MLTAGNENIREMFLGLDHEVEYEGGKKAAINLDCAATTPPLVKVVEEINRQMLMYGSIGRGTGQKSRHSSAIYSKGRDAVLDFVGADKNTYTVIYTNCATDGMNKLASALVESHRDVILTTRMEHHANDLPWRERARTVYVDVDMDNGGRLRFEEFENILEKYNWYTDADDNKVFKGTIKYVCVTAASNVTGCMNDVHKIAGIAHKHGAKIVVDGAQIIAHREFRMKGATPEEDIDFLVFSAHKMYSPFGGGAIVGLKDVLNARLPVFYGGGMVDKVTDNDVLYSKAPDLYEAGSPNYPGVVGMITAMETLKSVGFDSIKRHEEDLLRYALSELQKINEDRGTNEVILYGDGEKIDDRVGILVFNILRRKSGDVADFLARHAAIAVRSAKFCAHTYVDRLLGNVVPARLEGACLYDGLVRVSFGLFSTEKDVDELVSAIRDLLDGTFDAVFTSHRDAAAESAVGLPNDRG